MKIDNSIEDIRYSHRKLAKNPNGRIAVIVLTPYTKDRATYGVQFWTPQMIQNGKSENTDKTISEYIETL